MQPHSRKFDKVCALLSFAAPGWVPLLPPTPFSTVTSWGGLSPGKPSLSPRTSPSQEVQPAPKRRCEALSLRGTRLRPCRLQPAAPRASPAPRSHTAAAPHGCSSTALPPAPTLPSRPPSPALHAPDSSPPRQAVSRRGDRSRPVQHLPLYPRPPAPDLAEHLARCL